MLYEEERKNQIADYVQEHGRASVQELAQHFQVSESTVRRDLKELEEANRLRRTHGGAIALQDDNIEPPFTVKEDRFRLQKEAIAKTAAAMIHEGDIILLDSGTTTYYLAKELKAFNKLTVVTNSLMASQELANHPGIDLLLAGGTLRHETLATVGPVADRTFDSVRVDKAFLAINGIDPKAGLTTPNLLEAATKRRMIECAAKVILLADHSKYGRVSYAKVAELGEVHHCIMDDGISGDAIGELKTAGVNITLASLARGGAT
ncbi:DeoR/GlpR family DNA-binding transcription regulator [Paenibacillus alkalitolerans]|uniref:DeoR/GlpR family DNA-binding transcription regulator n=1 Tax=Paenibacillus alkalitolerans TaxID=2799335 RepID=UPI0018F59DAA|nr:DeoR/GlpR family DNA-binding transcription regulator [Paenibacillus alkalitolerans]